MDESYTNDLFPECDYKPSYIIERKIGRYQGVNLVSEALFISHLRIRQYQLLQLDTNLRVFSVHATNVHFLQS